MLRHFSHFNFRRSGLWTDKKPARSGPWPGPPDTGRSSRHGPGNRPILV